MTEVHQAIILYIREQKDAKLTQELMSISDEQLLCHMFSTYRYNDSLRLTQLGLQIMSEYFQQYELKRPQDEKTIPKHLLQLDANAKMPYYLSEAKIVVYDYVLAMQLRLIGGRLSILTEIL